MWMLFFDQTQVAQQAEVVGQPSTMVKVPLWLDCFKGDLLGTPKDMGPPYGKRDPYHLLPVENQVAVPTGATPGQQINFTLPNGKGPSGDKCWKM